MSNYRPISSQQELEQLIERYFNGMTTVAEEAALRHVLAHCPWSSEDIDDARVVMGYFMTHCKQQQRQHATASTRQRIIGIAASIAIILAVGGYTLWHQQQSRDICVAYVNGQVVQSNDQVMAMIADDLDRIDNAANAMTDQLSSLGEALELDNE